MNYFDRAALQGQIAIRQNKEARKLAKMEAMGDEEMRGLAIDYAIGVLRKERMKRKEAQRKQEERNQEARRADYEARVKGADYD